MMTTACHAKLNAARAKRDAARVRFEDADKAAQAAASLVVQCESELGQFDGLQQEIAQYRASAIKRGEAGSGLSGDLVLRKKSREKAANSLDEARSAHALLAAEMAEAKTELTWAERAVADAATAILLDEAGALLADLQSARAAVVDMEDLLFALGCIWVEVPGEPRPKPFLLPPELLAAARNGERSHPPITVPRPENPDQQKWAARYKALCNGVV